MEIRQLAIYPVKGEPGRLLEEAQVERLAGVAWSAPDVDAMRTQVEQLLSDPAARAEVERNMDALSRPDSSYAVAAEVAQAALASEKARQAH